jgi:tetratricopeptide (TPR) repeat protein
MKYLLVVLSSIFICFIACKKTQPQETIHLQNSEFQEIEYPQDARLPETEYIQDIEYPQNIQLYEMDTMQIPQMHVVNSIQDTPDLWDNSVREVLLDDKYGYESVGYYGLSYVERERRQLQSKEHFFEAIDAYNKNAVYLSMLNLESALKLYTLGVYYYHYGVCFMDIHDYEYAEKAFFKALQIIDHRNPYYESDSNMRPIYTFDNNGAFREKYFIYYNLACIYSLTNRLDLAQDNLKEALENGYPYIEYLYNDPDLYNLFNSSTEIRSQIQEIYDNGFINTLSGRAFEESYASTYNAYYFNTDRDINLRANNRFQARRGTYEIKNYQIIIRYNSELVEMSWNIINETDIINMKKMFGLKEILSN